MIRRRFEDDFTKEEQKLLESFEEDEDYTILDETIIEKLIQVDNDNYIDRTCHFNLIDSIIDWIYSWFK